MPFKEITSPQNSRIKELIKLRQAKYRRENGLFVVENSVIICDAKKSGFNFQSLFVTEEFFTKNKDVMDLLEKDSSSAEWFLIDEKTNKAFSELSTPSGVAAIYKIEKIPLADESIVYLDDISDPGNLGAIMRSALAFGFENLVLSKDCADPYSAKTISAAKDTIFKLRLFEDRDGAWLSENRLPVYATSSHEGVALGGLKPAEKFCLVLGSESQGVSPEILKSAKQKIKITISNKIESLNVAAAAAILFYELKK
ncbi:MAG: TrmH family RNA methyltransferase [Patescibacteria group bacterium]